ncbi:MAG TPA: hypothetical protein VKA64_02135 [Gammaproteobacteria bacterium]|nr:hypothetical protein [Gammaproteobacteria bacterium]
MTEQLPNQPAAVRAYLEKHRPDLVAAIREEGAACERERIQAVHDLAKDAPGHQALIQTLMFDGHTTGGEAAMQVLNAERHARTPAADNHQAATPARFT